MMNTQNKETLQVTESLAALKIKENSTSRVLKSIPSEKERNEYFVGLNNQKNSQIHLAYLEDKSNKINASKFFSFEDYLIDLYPSLNDKKILLTQTLNINSSQYDLKLVNLNLEEGTVASNESIFDLDNKSRSILDAKFSPSNENLLYLTNLDELRVYDIENKKFVNNLDFSKEESSNNPIQLSTDITPEYENQFLAKGIDKNLSLYDLKSNSLISSVKGAHYNGILSVSFVPHTFTICTSGMDNTIKYWDLKNLSEPVQTIVNNNHWIWQVKHNKVYNRIMISCSSNSTVRCNLFQEGNESQSLDYVPNVTLNEIDYNQFDDSVYAVDWSTNDPWSFAAISYNSNFHINVLPDNLRYQALLSK